MGFLYFDTWDLAVNGQDVQTDPTPAILDVRVVGGATPTPPIPVCSFDDGSLNPDIQKGEVCKSNWTPTPMSECPVRNDNELCIMPDWEIYLEKLQEEATKTPVPGTTTPYAGGTSPGNYASQPPYN